MQMVAKASAAVGLTGVLQQAAVQLRPYSQQAVDLAWPHLQPAVEAATPYVQQVCTRIILAIHTCTAMGRAAGTSTPDLLTTAVAMQASAAVQPVVQQVSDAASQASDYAMAALRNVTAAWR